MDVPRVSSNEGMKTTNIPMMAILPHSKISEGSGNDYFKMGSFNQKCRSLPKIRLIMFVIHDCGKLLCAFYFFSKRDLPSRSNSGLQVLSKGFSLKVDFWHTIPQKAYCCLERNVHFKGWHSHET